MKAFNSFVAAACETERPNITHPSCGVKPKIRCVTLAANAFEKSVATTSAAITVQAARSAKARTSTSIPTESRKKGIALRMRLVTTSVSAAGRRR